MVYYNVLCWAHRPLRALAPDGGTISWWLDVHVGALSSLATAEQMLGMFSNLAQNANVMHRHCMSMLFQNLLIEGCILLVRFCSFGSGRR